jgi:uncharacterized membrane protein
MMVRLFWIAAGLAAAAASYAGFLLFVPGLIFSAEIARMSNGHGSNSFFILAEKDQAKLLPGLPQSGVTGLCLFDVSKTGVTLSANLPEGFWITTIYSDKGETIYTVNNRQSGSNTFNVSLSRAPGFLELLAQATEKERPEIDSGWTVQSPEPRGLAVVWYPLPDPALREAAAAAVARSSCSAAVQPSQ